MKNLKQYLIESDDIRDYVMIGGEPSDRERYVYYSRDLSPPEKIGNFSRVYGSHKGYLEMFKLKTSKGLEFNIPTTERKVEKLALHMHRFFSQRGYRHGMHRFGNHIFDSDTNQKLASGAGDKDGDAWTDHKGRSYSDVVDCYGTLLKEKAGYKEKAPKK